MEDCIKKMRNFYYQMMFIQKRLRHKLETQDAKIDVIMNYWDKIYGKMQLKATKNNDKKANLLLKKMVLVSHDVKYHCIRKYIKKCKELHAIAFL